MNNPGSDSSTDPPFKPTAHYRRSGDQLVVYWDVAESFADETDGRYRITLLRAFKDEKKITGVKVWGLPEVVSILGKPDFSPSPVDRSRDADGAFFVPYAWHDEAGDALRLRWLPGVEVPEERHGHIRFTLLRDKADPDLLLGIVLFDLAKVLRVKM
jgi:hypothetical protein